jgi:chaperonin GroEL
LEANKRSITTSAEIAQVATISANGDKHVGQLIATAMEKVPFAVFTQSMLGAADVDNFNRSARKVLSLLRRARRSKTRSRSPKACDSTVATSRSLLFWFVYEESFTESRHSPYFVTDVKSQKVEYEKPLILLSEKKISLLQDVLPSLEAAAQQRRPLVIIAEDVDGEALAACILNKLRGQLQVTAVKAPGFGDNRKSILGDLAILTGGTVFSDELDIKLEKATPDLRKILFYHCFWLVLLAHTRAM